MHGIEFLYRCMFFGFLSDCVFVPYVSFLPCPAYGRGVCKANGKITSRGADHMCMLIEEASLMTRLLLVGCRA